MSDVALLVALFLVQNKTNEMKLEKAFRGRCLGGQLDGRRVSSRYLSHVR